MSTAQQKRPSHQRKAKEAGWGPYFWVLVALVVFMIAWQGYQWYKARPPVAEDLAALEEKVNVVQEIPEMISEPIEKATIDTTWNSDPATSGPYLSDVPPAEPGLYKAALPTEVLVYNLKLGHVVVYYHPENVKEPELTQLQALVDQYRDTPYPVIVVQRPDPDYPLIATAWTRILRLDAPDVDRIAAFARRFRGKAPDAGGGNG